MQNIKDYISFLKKQKNNLNSEIENIIDSNSETILEILKRRLYVTGLPGYEYSETTIDIKQALGLPEDRVTLFHTGTLYKSFRLQYINGIISVYQDDATLASYPKLNDDDWKSGNAFFSSTIALDGKDYEYPLRLMQQYGDDIFDFEIEEQQRIVRDIVDKGLNKYLNDNLVINIDI